MYHRVGNEPGDFWTVPSGDFDSQMRFLKEQGYTTILPKDLVDGKPLPAKPVILTFDDGYLSVKTEVEPVLRKYGFRGIAYLITSLVGETETNRMQNEGHDCLVWPEVRALQAGGTIVFGGHGERHVRLDKVDDPLPLVKKCFDELQSHLGVVPDSFCYPYGNHNPAAERAVRHAGFTTAVTAGEELADARDLLTLSRFWVRGGKHEFVVEELACEGGSVSCAIRHEGIAIPVTLQLSWKADPNGAISERVGEWGSGALKRQWTLPGATNVRALTLEIWDRNHFFPLFKQTKELNTP
jgi:peptidoglycan/xylan/chitin deacetylase (PgdA/CDA1 family)